MTQRATGTFAVTLNPLAAYDATDDPSRGRMSIDKTFEGDLTGVSRGEMLTAATEIKTSAAYVAIERIVGTLAGRQGSFTLQHTGTMNRGAFQLAINVVPDSGAGELAGLSGTLAIIMVDGKHGYTFDYTIGETA